MKTATIERIVMPAWWTKLLEERERQGAEGADYGEFLPPYPGSDDPQDEDENAAYKRGFDKRRLELGSFFAWHNDQAKPAAPPQGLRA